MSARFAYECQALFTCWLPTGRVVGCHPGFKPTNVIDDMDGAMRAGVGLWDGRPSQ